MADRFDGKVVIVTGASRGIGGTAAVNFAKAGATVVRCQSGRFCQMNHLPLGS